MNIALVVLGFCLVTAGLFLLSRAKELTESALREKRKEADREQRDAMELNFARLENVLRSIENQHGKTLETLAIIESLNTEISRGIAELGEFLDRSAGRVVQLMEVWESRQSAMNRKETSE